MMSDQQFIARLRKIQEKEKALCRRESELAKAGLKYLVAFNLLEKTIRAESVPTTHMKRQQQLEATNRQLQELLRNEEVALEKCKQENLRLQEEEQLSTAQELEEERICTAYRERLHMLQQICNIHINTKTLPDVLQGMVICERSQERNWVPFRFSTNDVDKQQIREILWNLTEPTDIYGQQWKYLICGTPQRTE